MSGNIVMYKTDMCKTSVIISDDIFFSFFNTTSFPVKHSKAHFIATPSPEKIFVYKTFAPKDRLLLGVCCV